MERYEHYRKTDEYIAKFKNGKEQYQKSALFNRCIQTLVRTDNPYEIIDQLINITEDNQKALEQYMYRDTRPMLFEKG